MRVSKLACFVVALSASAVFAEDAVDWFGKATYTTNADEQIYYYNKALAADPGYTQAAHNLAGVYYRKGYVHKSIALYEQLIRTSKAYYQTFYNLACCYARTGDQQHAVKALQRAFQKGFHDKKLVERDEDLAQVRLTPQYAQLAAKYLGGQRIAAAVEAEAPAEAPAAKPHKLKHPKAHPAKPSAPAQLAAKPKKPRSAAHAVGAQGALDPVKAAVVVKKHKIKARLATHPIPAESAAPAPAESSAPPPAPGPPDAAQ